MINIEKSVPIPEGKTKPRIYPFSTMELGDSFFVKNGTSARAAASHYSAGTDRKFTTRKEGEGYRVWRVK